MIPDKNWKSILWRSLLTSLGFAIIETILLILMLVLIDNVRFLFENSSARNLHVFQFFGIVRACLFALGMRAVLGFIPLNFMLWVIFASSPVRLPIFAVAFVNAVPNLVMYWAWDSSYAFLHELVSPYPLESIFDLFNVYRGILLCSFLAPFILPKLKWLPTIMPWILRSQETATSCHLPPSV